VHGGQALVAGTDLVAPDSFQVSEEPDHPLEGEISQRQARDFAVSIDGDELKEQPDRVPVASHRRGPQPFDGDQVVERTIPAGNSRGEIADLQLDL
jgi:hypothetical protein